MVVKVFITIYFIINFISVNNTSVIVDNINPISNISAIEYARDGSIIIYDSGNVVSFLRKDEGDYVQQLILNKIGSGPCEYESITDISYKNGSLYLLDRTLSKYISYRVNAGGSIECYYEYEDEKLTRMTSLQKSSNGLYFGTSLYSDRSGDNLAVLYKKSDDTLVSKSIELSKIKPSLLPAPIQIPIPMYYDDEHLYMGYPLTNHILKYNINNRTVSKINIGIKIPSERDISSITDMESLMRVVDNTEFPMNIIGGCESVYAITKRTDDKNTWTIKDIYKNEIIYQTSDKMIVNISCEKIYYHDILDGENPHVIKSVDR